MSSFLCFVCHSTVNADTNEDTRDKYREVIGMNLCPDSHLCFICCHFLNKMWLFKSICLKRSLEYPVLFSEKGTINLQISDTQVGILCPEDICLQHRNSKYHFYNNDETSPPDFEENKYVQLHEDMNFSLLPNNVEVQTDDIFDHFNDNFLKSDDVNFNNEFLVSISKESNEVNTRKDIDEFIFGNDSIESPLENINKIELANLDEMTEVNITLTDLNVRNFEKLQESGNYMEKTYYRNDFIEKSEDCNVRDNFVEKSQEIKSYVVKPEYYERNDQFVDKTEDTNNKFINRSPHLVRNIDFIEKPHELLIKNNDFDESVNAEIQESTENDSTNESYNENKIDHTSDDENEPDNSNEASSETEETVDNKNNQKPKKYVFTKIKLSLEEQKSNLEECRRSKKYTDAVFKCYSCAMGFLFKDSYQAHMMRHEESNGEHRCCICTLRFANPAVLRSHRANHAVRYQCSHCWQTIGRQHRLTHDCCGRHNTGVTCHLCANVFKSSRHVSQHLKRAHSDASRRAHLCNVCGKNFNNQAAVRTHMLTHINRKFTCDVCSSSFSSPYTLNQHKKRHDYIKPSLHYCVTCNIRYNSRKSLLAHQRNALAHKERVYKCVVCDKTCPSLRSLQNHTSSVHAHNKDHYCAHCPARYATRKGLVRHTRSHSDARPKLAPLCHKCGQTFKNAGILKRHLKNICEKDKLEEELSSYYEQ